MFFIQIILYITFIILIYQDVTARKIWWFLPLIIFVGGIFLAQVTFLDLGFSILFIVFLIGTLFAYIYFRFKSTRLFKDYFGFGDLLLLIAITPFFSPTEFVYFFTIGTVITLVVFLIFNLFKKVKTIPYAGLMSVVFLAHWTVIESLHFNALSLFHV